MTAPGTLAEVIAAHHPILTDENYCGCGWSPEGWASFEDDTTDAMAPAYEAFARAWSEHVEAAASTWLGQQGDVTDEQIVEALLSVPVGTAVSYASGNTTARHLSHDEACRLTPAVRALLAQAQAVNLARIAELEAELRRDHEDGAAAVISEAVRAREAEDERDALRATVERVRAECVQYDEIAIMKIATPTQRQAARQAALDFRAALEG